MLLVKKKFIISSASGASSSKSSIITFSLFSIFENSFNISSLYFNIVLPDRFRRL